MGGQTVSHITIGVAQCDILKNRLTKNNVYNKSIGVAQGLAGHHYDRRALLQNFGSDATRETYIDGFVTEQDPEVKSELEYPERFDKMALQRNRNKRFFIWQPGLGIFDYSQPLGAAEYEIQLNPSQDYQLSGVDTGIFSAPNDVDIHRTSSFTGTGRVTIKVHDMRFYACMCRVNLPSSGEETLHLMEMDMYTANINGSSSVVNGRQTGQSREVNEEFTVPSSTRALTMFIQDQVAGKNTSCPPSRFHNAFDVVNDAETYRDALSIKNYQIEYGNMTKPTIRYESDFSDNSQKLYQRYIQTTLESGQYFQLTGAETFEEWMERGPIFHETFVKSADNLATRAHVVANYGEISTNCRLFIVAHYSRTIKITRQNGLVVNVQSLNV
jgi:hypothetical protein